MYELNINTIRRCSFSGEGLKTSANTDTVTNLMEQNAWEADSCSGSQKITCCLWNWDVNISSLLGPFLNQISPLHTFLPCIFNIHVSIILTLSTACNVRNCVSLGVYSSGSVECALGYDIVSTWQTTVCVQFYVIWQSHVYVTVKNYGRAHREGASGNGRIAPVTLSVGTRWRWMFGIVRHPPLLMGG